MGEHTRTRECPLLLAGIAPQGRKNAETMQRGGLLFIGNCVQKHVESLVILACFCFFGCARNSAPPPPPVTLPPSVIPANAGQAGMTHNVTSLPVRTSIILPRDILHKLELSLTRRTGCKSLSVKDGGKKQSSRNINLNKIGRVRCKDERDSHADPRRFLSFGQVHPLGLARPPPPPPDKSIQAPGRI